jgi:ABC-type dipeptide/oligopeptide/nickel transport system permease subunit
MEFKLPIAAGVILAIIAAGTGGLIFSPIPMTAQTTLMMVAPSMLVFAAIVFVIGVKHGEYRASGL